MTLPILIKATVYELCRVIDMKPPKIVYFLERKTVVSSVHTRKTTVQLMEKILNFLHGKINGSLSLVQHSTVAEFAWCSFFLLHRSPARASPTGGSVFFCLVFLQVSVFHALCHVVLQYQLSVMVVKSMLSIIDWLPLHTRENVIFCIIDEWRKCARNTRDEIR